MVNTLKLLNRIKSSPDGPEFIEYLKQLEKDNYNAFISSPHTASELHKGYSICITSLIKVFENCTDRLSSLETPPDIKEWT